MLKHWRFFILGLLFAIPVLFLIGFGAYALWQNGVWTWLYWPITGCFALAYFLAWYWQRNQQLLKIDFTPPLHWTERDQNAWKLVEARAKAGDKIAPDKLTNFEFYAETAKEM